MYESYYGFHEKPFALTPDPAFLFATQKHHRALTLLQYGLMNQVGFSVVTGAIGSGKTLLLRKLLRQLDDDVTVGMVSHVQCDTFEEMLRWILLAFELDYRDKGKVELSETFVEFLIKEYGEGRRVVLIIDEAQHLGPAALEQLRMLSNVNVDKHQLLQLILVGQPQLLQLLQRPELEQFVQRIGVDYYLEPLEQSEVKGYIQHRLRVAGGDPELFDEDTYELVWRSTGGIPRLINLLCDMTLVYGYAEQKSKIDKQLIENVIRDKQRGLSPIGKIAQVNSSDDDNSVDKSNIKYLEE